MSNEKTGKELRWKNFPVGSGGSVCLVDWMGDDYSIVEAARVSYGDGTRHTSDDRSLIRYLMRHWHCYDAETEVLTEKGFVPWPSVKDEMKLGIWDENKGSLCYETPEYLVSKHYEGRMYRVEHGGVDLLVTPNHKMWVKTKKWQEDNMRWCADFSLVEAEDLDHRSMVRYAKTAPLTTPEDWITTDSDSNRSMLRLFGFFIGDGSVGHGKNNSSGITFNLRKRNKIVYLRELCEEIGISYTEKEGRFYLAGRERADYFRKIFYDPDGNKILPNFLLSLNAPDSRAILEGLKNSDGTSKRGAWEYFTSSSTLAEQIQILGLHAGEAVHLGIIHNPSPKHKNIHRLMFLSRMREPVINQGKKNTSWEHYSGNVYCAKTRTGVLVVRRNGKIVLSGNSTPFEMAELKFRVRVPMDTWRQWIRHRTANVNEYSTRYSVAIDEFCTTPPESWRLQAESNRQGSEGLLGITEGGAMLSSREEQFHKQAREIYEERLEQGVAREQARKDLPLSNYTEAYWKSDLHNIFNFLRLRMDSHAQQEIREFATVIGEEIVAKLFPLAWEAFVDYRLESTQLTRLDTEVIRNMIILSRTERTYTPEENFEKAQPAEWNKLKRCRERDECREKLIALGILNGR